MNIAPESPAFACASEHFDSVGMTLRTYLAGQAMQGMIAFHGDPSIREEMAIRAVASADALIAALNRPQ